MEEWRKIENFPTYSVSDEGRVRNDKTGRIMKTQTNHRGYHTLDLRKDKKQYSQRVHRLVADTFIGGDHAGLDVNHKNGNKDDNSVANLEFCTRKENINHAFRTGLKKPSRMIPIRVTETGQEFESIRECARALNLQQNSICYCLNGKQRSTGGYHFERAE